jgi:hypothetical protein
MISGELSRNQSAELQRGKRSGEAVSGGGSVVSRFNQRGHHQPLFALRIAPGSA